jgi:hypothetical protein
MNGDRFRSVWKVIANSMGGDYPGEHYAFIELVSGTNYRLSSGSRREGPWKEEQLMNYNNDTGMLENESGKRGRVIAFWERSANGSGLKDCIFAMRRKPEEDSGDDDLLPWEQRVNRKGEPDDQGTAYVGENGSWGAEGG